MNRSERIEEMVQETEETRLNQQLYALVQELAPVLKGDLRVRVTIPSGNMGVLAEICNALIDKLVQFTRWTLYSAEKMVQDSRLLLDHSLAQVHTVESQMLQLAHVIKALEGTLASAQRVSNTLHSSAENSSELYKFLRQSQATVEREVVMVSSGDRASRDALTLFAPHRLEQILTDGQRQTELLEEAARTLPETVDVSEAAINDLYNVVQHLYASCTQVFQATEELGTVIKIATDWQNTATIVSLPEAETATIDEEDLAEAEKESAWLL